MRHFNTSQQPG